MHQTQLVLNVFQCISVSPAIPVRMEQHVISVLITTLTTPAHVFRISPERIALVRMIQLGLKIINIEFRIQSVFSLVHWVMSQTQIVLNVFQCISVSPAIPVRMEQRVISVLTATLTTPALALKMFGLELIALV